MMNNEQEIEKIAIDLQGEVEYSTQIDYDFNYAEVEIDYESTAKNLINKGIGDKKQAVKEFVLRLKSYTRLSTDGVSYRESVDIRAINELFTELYGE